MLGSLLNSVSILEEDLSLVLPLLDPSKNRCIDDIGPRVLNKHCAIHYLVSPCLSTQHIRDEWHAHLIVPDHKSGGYSSVTNYRLISLLCFLSKV